MNLLLNFISKKYSIVSVMVFLISMICVSAANASDPTSYTGVPYRMIVHSGTVEPAGCWKLYFNLQGGGGGTAYACEAGVVSTTSEFSCSSYIYSNAVFDMVREAVKSGMTLYYATENNLGNPCLTEIDFWKK